MGNGRPKNTAASFWQNVRIDGRCGACWEWTLSTKNGYGRFTVNRIEHYAHRYAYALVNSAAPSGKAQQVMHKCNNKLCCRPSHLVLGTAAQNTQDAYRDGLAKAVTKIPAETIAKIRADDRPQNDLAKSYGVSQSYISVLKRGLMRRGVNG